MKKLLIVIDMQNDFISGAPGTKEAEAIVPAVIEKITDFDGDVVYTRDTHSQQYLDTAEGEETSGHPLYERHRWLADPPRCAPDRRWENGRLWAAKSGITNGTSATTFSPDATCTRAQMATFIYRNEQANGGGFTGAWMFQVPFTDAPEWAFEAIAWCYMKGITGGTSATTFSPNDPCTSAQMVTFLYRYMAE